MKRVNAFASNQRGEGRIKFFLIVAIVAAITVILVRGLPVYVTDQQLQHDVKEAARIGAVRNSSEGQVLKELDKDRQDYWVTLPENIYNVKKLPHGFQIEVDTTIPINFIVTTYDYKINIKAMESEL